MTLINHTKAYVAALAFLLLTPLASWAEAVGTFTRVEGQVDVLPAGGTEAAMVRVGDPVNMGDAIRTKRNSKAEIRFKDESVIQLAPETRITVDAYSFRGQTRERGIIGLFRGKLRAVVSKLRASVVPASLGGGSDFNIKTPTAIAGIKGTDLIVYYDRGVSGVVFLSGEGFVFNPNKPDQVVPIKGGQATAVANANTPPRAATAVSNAFVAPFLKATSASLTGSSEGNNGNGESSGMDVDVASSSSSYSSLSGDSLGDLGNGETGGNSSQLLDTIVSGGSGGVMGTDGTGNVNIPVTDTNPNLLTTKVTVKVATP